MKVKRTILEKNFQHLLSPGGSLSNKLIWPPVFPRAVCLLFNILRKILQIDFHRFPIVGPAKSAGSGKSGNDALAVYLANTVIPHIRNVHVSFGIKSDSGRFA